MFKTREEVDHDIDLVQRIRSGTLAAAELGERELTPDDNLVLHYCDELLTSWSMYIPPARMALGLVRVITTSYAPEPSVSERLAQLSEVH